MLRLSQSDTRFRFLLSKLKSKLSFKHSTPERQSLSKSSKSRTLLPIRTAFQAGDRARQGPYTRRRAAERNTVRVSGLSFLKIKRNLPSQPSLYLKGRRRNF